MPDSYRHWSEVPQGRWRWANFSPAEIACRGDGAILIDDAALDALQALRDDLAKPMIVRSAYRSPDYNRRVGGARRSQHLLGRAFDIAMANHDPHEFEAAALRHGFRGIGIYPRPEHDFIHIDTRPRPARWTVGGEFASRDRAFGDLPPPRPARQAARDGTATVVAGVVVEDQLAEIEALAPLLPPDWGTWLLAGTAAVAVGVAAWHILRRHTAEPEDGA